MPKRLEKCFILTLNVSLEFENTEVNSTFFYSSAEEREKLVASERKFTDDKVRKIVELKNKVCSGEKSNYGFFVVNQKGIDPPSLDMLAKEGIMAVRRAKRRNMERITLACGGNALNSVDDLCASDLGFADLVYEKALGDDKYTFIEGVANPQSCTILIKGPNDHEINQLKDAVRDGLRSVRNSLIDKCLIPGAGAFELACRYHLLKYAKTVAGKTRLGVEIFADALLVVPRTLAENSGFDVQETILRLEEELEAVGQKEAIGLDVYSGEPISPEMEGIYDNYAVKRQMLMLAPVLAEQMLLVDEVIRAGKQMGGGQ
jgi:T-complex protein 1 subunit zeta